MPRFGGDSSSVARALQDGVVHVTGGGYAFAAIKADGTVVTWGDPSRGGELSEICGYALQEVVHITANSSAFAAIKANGRVVTWGCAASDPGSVNSQLRDGVVEVHGAGYSFAALKAPVT